MMGHDTDRIRTFKENLNRLHNFREAWKLILQSDNLEFMIDNIAEFAPIDREGYLIPNTYRYLKLLAILSTWKSGAFTKLLNAFELADQTKFLNQLLKYHLHCMTPFETTLLLSPDEIRLEVRGLCTLRGVAIDKLALRSPELIYKPNALPMENYLQDISSFEAMPLYLCQQVGNTFSYYHYSILRLAHYTFGIYTKELDAGILDKSQQCKTFLRANRISSLKRHLNKFKDITKCWALIELSDNRNFILDNITDFIPVDAGNLHPNAEHYFNPLAILCIWRPEAFRTLLAALAPHKTTFLSTILCHNGHTITQFETALILSSKTVCKSIRTITNNFCFDLNEDNQFKLALAICKRLNNVFNFSQDLAKVQEAFSPYYKQSRTKNNICDQIKCFPSHYHIPLIHLAHTAFNISIEELAATMIDEFSNILEQYVRYTHLFTQPERTL